MFLKVNLFKIKHIVNQNNSPTYQSILENLKKLCQVFNGSKVDLSFGSLTDGQELFNGL